MITPATTAGATPSWAEDFPDPPIKGIEYSSRTPDRNGLARATSAWDAGIVPIATETTRAGILAAGELRGTRTAAGDGRPGTVATPLARASAAALAAALDVGGIGGAAAVERGAAGGITVSCGDADTWVGSASVDDGVYAVRDRSP